MCRRAAALALAAAGVVPGGADLEVAIVLADDDLLRGLNRDYRGRDAATNVLAFPALEPARIAAGKSAPEGAPVMLGDVVVALQTTRAEAAAQKKRLGDHLSHLVVHGVLHLAGCDHESAGRAKIMEGLETRVLSELDVPDPYAPRPGALK